MGASLRCKKRDSPRCALVEWWALSGLFLPRTLGLSHDRSWAPDRGKANLKWACLGKKASVPWSLLPARGAALCSTQPSFQPHPILFFPPKLSYNLLTVWLLLCSKPSRFISRYQYLYLCCVCSVFENRFCSPVLFPVMFGGRGYVHNQQLHDYNCVYLECRGTRPRPLCIATGPSRLLTGSAQAQRFTVY